MWYFFKLFFVDLIVATSSVDRNEIIELSVPDKLVSDDVETAVSMRIFISVSDNVSCFLHQIGFRFLHSDSDVFIFIFSFRYYGFWLLAFPLSLRLISEFYMWYFWCFVHYGSWLFAFPIFPVNKFSVSKPIDLLVFYKIIINDEVWWRQFLIYIQELRSIVPVRKKNCYSSFKCNIFKS